MYFLYFYHVYFYSFMCSYHVPSIRLCMTSIYSFHLFINNLRIYYLLYYSFIRISLFTYTYFTIHIYLFYYSFIRILLFTIHYLPFTIYHLLFNIYYLLLTICYLGKNPYLMEFDQTPKFWCPCVARDAWINLTFCSD